MKPREYHGLRKHPLYGVWAAMLQRCSNPSNANYKDYGLRGISVCEEWKSFARFLKDMGERPFAGASIERRDNDKGYNLSNCKWATSLEQGKNTRRNTWVFLNGVKKHLSEWCRIYDMDTSVVVARIRSGWPMEHIFDAAWKHEQLRPDEIEQIKILRSNGVQRKIVAEMFAVHPVTVSYVMSGRIGGKSS